MDKVGEGEWEVQASSHGMCKSQGGKEPHGNVGSSTVMGFYGGRCIYTCAEHAMMHGVVLSLL